MGLSQRELGRLVGFAPDVAAPRINQYERGSAAPLAEDLQQLASALGLPAAALVTEDPALHRMLVAWADARVTARRAAVKQLEADAARAGHPERARVLRRIEESRRQWDAEREAERLAREKARKKVEAKARVAKPAAKAPAAKGQGAKPVVKTAIKTAAKKAATTRTRRSR